MKGGNIGKIVAVNIKKLREKQGYTQEQLGDYLGISKEQVSYIENLKRPIDVIKLKKIADLFGIQVDDLMNEEITKNLDIAYSFRTEFVDGSTLEAVAFLNEFSNDLLRLRKIFR
jgi:transcriptional regulator with XRE-family HTH domain